MDNKSIIGYLIVVIILVVGLVMLGSRNTAPATASPDDPNRPQAVVDSKLFDFGDMSNNDIRDHVFSVTNNGQSDLVLSQVSTSCDCTYAYITANGETSPKFTMHGTNKWSTNVKSGERAEIKIVYEPAIMPVHGPVTRMVAITTNDPVNPTLEFNISANLTD